MNDKTLKSQELFQNKPVWTAIFSMAIPSCITILVMFFYNMADMFFIGQLGDTAQVAAISIVSPVFSLATAAATMLGIGGCSVIAKAAGAGEIEDAKTYASLCFYAAAILGGICTIVMLAASNSVLGLLGANAEIFVYAKNYMQILAFGAPMMLLSTTLASLLRADGAIKEGLIGNMTGTILNIILDPIFILALGWGVKGAAVATLLGNAVSTIYYVIYILKKGQTLSLKPLYAIRKPKSLLHIIAVGMPNGISSILSGFAATFSNNLLVLYGTNAVASMAAAGKTTMIISMIQMGICMGVQPMLAYNYGARNVSRLKEVLKDLSILTVIIGFVAAAGCILARNTLIGMFLKDAAAAGMGKQLVIYLVLASPVIGFYYLGTNFLQAAGNAVAATVISLLRQGLLLIPFLFLMNHLMGFLGIALAHPLADGIATAAAVAVMYRQYKVLKTTIIKREEKNYEKNPDTGKAEI
ncbi:MATE family efflux transporter [Clostridium sp. C105KSO13]|uniref:MATE family efflux transporter n=1 Tax=Clostridium sp. C105KSO13 TaxID=1776045 RepID=UPI00074087F2|nr:MATE family efflux transporter [Clostridium sp. C105KSO13]CUX25132.1 Multidrug export protein MepA [Clostridium sp. C105KSO13]